jgi:hypothetical protein
MPEPKEPVEPPPTRTIDEVRQDDKATSREERVKLSKVPPRVVKQAPAAPVKKSKK